MENKRESKKEAVWGGGGGNEKADRGDGREARGGRKAEKQRKGKCKIKGRLAATCSPDDIGTHVPRPQQEPEKNIFYLK